MKTRILAVLLIEPSSGFSDMKAMMPHESAFEASVMENPSVSSLSPLTGLSLAMAYVPYQHFDNLNEAPKALEQGTLFKELYMPFTGQKRRPPV